MKSAIALAALLLAGPALAQVKGEAGGIYVAGDPFPLEQALADAARDNAGRYAVVVLGPEVAKLTLKGASPAQSERVRQAQRSGAEFFLCGRDLRSAGLSRRDLLPGVKVERGWTKEELRAEDARKPATGARRIRRLCS